MIEEDRLEKPDRKEANNVDESLENPIEDIEEIDDDDLTYDYSGFEVKDSEYGGNASQSQTHEAKDTSNVQSNTQPSKLQENMKTAEILIKSNDGTYILILCCAIVVIISSIAGNRNRGVGTSPSGFVVGTIFGIFALILGGVSYYAVKKESSGVLTQMQRLYLLLAKSGIWSLLTLWLTNIDEYFGVTSNGYFALWIGALLTYKLLLTTTGLFSPLLYQVRLVGWQLGMLILSSGMLITASIIKILEEASTPGILGVGVGAVSAAASFGTFLGISRIPQNGRIAIFGILTLLWLVAAVILTTSGGIFDKTGNGYFASWGGLVSSVLLLSQVLNLNTSSGILQSSSAANEQTFV